MARWLKQSTAHTFRIGPFVDSTTGVDAETGLSIAQGDIQISKAGGAFAQTSEASPTTTHDADGWYQCPLTATDTNTLGTLTVQIVMSGALPVWEHFMVLPANVYDSLVGGTDTLDVQVTGMGAGVVTASAIATDAIDADALAADAIAEINATVDTAISDASLATAAALATAQADLDTLTGADGATLATLQPNYAPATAANLATLTSYVDTEVAAIKAVTDLIPDGGALTALLASIATIQTDTTTDIPALIASLNNLSAADVNAEVVDALATDTYAEPGSVPAATATLAAKIGWLYLLSRNKITQTADTQTVYADDGATSVATSTVSDDSTTATRGEFS